MRFSSFTLVAAVAAVAQAVAYTPSPFHSWATSAGRYTKVSVMSAGKPAKEGPSYEADYPASVKPEPEPEETPTVNYAPIPKELHYARGYASAEYVPKTTSVDSSSTEEHKTRFPVYSATVFPHRPTGYVQPHPVYETVTETCTLEHCPPKSTGYAHPTEHKYHVHPTTTPAYKPTGYVRPHPVYNATKTMTTIYTTSCDHPHGCAKPTPTPYHPIYSQTCSEAHCPPAGHHYAPAHNITSCPEGVKCNKKHCPEGVKCSEYEHPTEEHEPEYVRPAPCPSGVKCPSPSTPSGTVPFHGSPAASGYKPGHAAPTGGTYHPPQYTGAATDIRVSGTTVALAGAALYALYFL